LNSGPTTAGVLRGVKGRFQLFGDTVNTAARMESNGCVGRIQVSQSTADLLFANGKGHWLTPREDLVKAKGKGLLQTYWCCIPKSSGSSRTFSDSFVDHHFVTGDRDGSEADEQEIDAWERSVAEDIFEESTSLDDQIQQLD
jgi:hypothetical protein